MERVQDRRLLMTAIVQVEHNHQLRERMLEKPDVVANERRFTFLARYSEDLSATATLLRAIADPTTSKPEDLIKIILERPGIVACVRQFTMGVIPDPNQLIEAIQGVTIKRVQRQANH